MLGSNEGVTIVVSSTLHCRITRRLSRHVSERDHFDAGLGVRCDILPSCARLNVTTLLPRNSLRFSDGSHLCILTSKHDAGKVRTHATVLSTMNNGTVECSSLAGLGIDRVGRLCGSYGILCICRGRVSTANSARGARSRAISTYRGAFGRLNRMIGGLTDNGIRGVVVATSRKFLCRSQSLSDAR